MPVSMLSTSLFSDRKSYSRFNALDTIYTPPRYPGMVLMKPTSIANPSGSATLGTNGQVTFSGVTSLALNGCFNSDFDNYVVSMRLTTSGGADIQFRLRSGGTDATAANSYTFQQIYADGSTVSASRATGDLSRMATAYGTQRAGSEWHLYGPFLSQPTATRNISVSDYLSAYIVDYASTHNVSSSYDGFRLFPAGVITMTGALQVYGVRS